MDEQTLKRIEQYLFDRMTANEREQFELELEQDEQLKNEYRLVRLSYEAVERDIERDLRTELEELRQRKKGTGGSIVQMKPPLRGVAAAVVLLLIAGGYLFWAGQYSDTELFAKYYDPYTVELMRSGDQSENVLERATAKLQQGEYRQALRLLAPIQQEDSLFLEAKLIEAAVLESSGQTELAIERLQLVSSRTANILSDHAEWRLALLYLRKSDEERFDLLLEKIIDDEDHLYRSRALELKSDSGVPLRNLW